MFRGHSAPDTFLLNLGARVRAAREKLGWSQRKLAEEAFTRQATINDLENGKREPTIGTLLQIAGALETPLVSLIPLPPEERAKQDELPDWIREALKHMKYIESKSTQRQIIAMLQAAAEVEIKEAHNFQDKQLLKELDEKVSRGESLTPVEEKRWRALKDKFEDE